MTVIHPVWGTPDTYPLSVRELLAHTSPAALAQPCRAVRDVPLGSSVESLPLDRRIHPETFSKEGIEVELTQRLWAALPFPDEVVAVRPGRQRLFGDEPFQDGDNLQRCFRQVSSSRGIDDTYFLLRRRPVLLAGRKSCERLRQNLVAIAAQPFNVNLVA